ncbi:MAG: hypothetical protein ACYC26_08600 [Phycisphaerales bacterium]
MKRLGIVIVALTIWLIAGGGFGDGVAWAALPEKKPLPGPASPLWYAYLIAFVLIFGAAAITFKNAKRTHLD